MTPPNHEETVRELMSKMMDQMSEELHIWRLRYPHHAPFIREEAAAKIEGREPNYPPPFVRGEAECAATMKRWKLTRKSRCLVAKRSTTIQPIQQVGCSALVS